MSKLLYTCMCRVWGVHYHRHQQVALPQREEKPQNTGNPVSASEQRGDSCPEVALRAACFCVVEATRGVRGIERGTGNQNAMSKRDLE